MSNVQTHHISLAGATGALDPYVGQASEHQQLKWIGAGRLQVLLEAATTGGQLTVIDERLGHGDATPRHIHSTEDEIFFVLEGSITAWVGDQRHELAEGGIVFLPRNIPHAIRVTSNTARLLMMCTPGGIEGMFREAGWDLKNPLPEGWAVAMPHLAEASARYGSTIVGPPPSDHA